MNIRTLICTVFGLAAVFLLWMFIPHQIFVPKGIVLPAEHIRAPISPNSVKIYSEPPIGNYQTLGSVRTELTFDVLDTKTKDLLIQKVKTLAASVGANGVIVTLLVPNNGVRQMLMFIGTAIYTSSDRSH